MKVPHDIEGSHRLLCKYTNLKDTAGQSARVDDDGRDDQYDDDHDDDHTLARCQDRGHRGPGRISS